MNLATLSDQALKELITGKAAMEFDFLAAKILLSTLRSRFRLNSSPVALAQYVEEMKVCSADFSGCPPMPGRPAAMDPAGRLRFSSALTRWPRWWPRVETWCLPGTGRC